MENCGNLRADVRGAVQPAWRACSACAGDYQDPDRTAWEASEEGASESDGLDEVEAQED